MTNLNDENSLELLKSLLGKINSGEDVKESHLHQELQSLIEGLDRVKRQEELAKLAMEETRERVLQEERAERRKKITSKASTYTRSQEKNCIKVSKDKILNKEFDIIQSVSESFLQSNYFKSLSPNSLFVYDKQTIGKKIVKEDGTIFVACHSLPTHNSYRPLSKIIEIRDCLQALYALEKTDASQNEIEQMRMQLNELYDTFFAQYAYLSTPKNSKLFFDDPAFEFIISLEAKEDNLELGEKESLYKKASVFTKRIFQEITHDYTLTNTQEALMASFHQLGKVDFKAIAELLNIDADIVRRELEKANLVFYNPVSKVYELAEYYLSGNVKQKLLEVENALAKMPSLEVNKNALLKVIPKDIDMVDIALSLGSPWLYPYIIEDFIKESFPSSRISVFFLKEIGMWKITRFDLIHPRNRWGIKVGELKLVIKNMICQKAIIAYEKDKDPQKGFSQIDKVKTQELQLVAEDIHKMFISWIWRDNERKQGLARKYNELYNTNVLPIYNSRNYELKNANPVIHLRKHQKDAIYRSIVEGTVLFDHVVGAGKTYVAIGSILESKRLGKFKKPLVVVPNHLLEQWKKAFYELYPDCKILVVQTEDLGKSRVENLYYKIATSDYDAIIIKHSCLRKFIIPAEFEVSLLDDQISAYKKALNNVHKDHAAGIRNPSYNRLYGQSKLVNTMDKLSMKFESHRAYLEDRLDKNSELIDLKSLKIDALVIDEAHEFKNLPFETRRGRIIGIGNPDGSFAAMDLFLKCRYIQAINGGKNVFFLTGTPITNSISEVFHMQRFMQYKELEMKGMNHFDVWANIFGRITTTISLDVLGSSYVLENRFDRFNNLPELISMFRTFTDVVTKQDLEGELFRIGQKSDIPQLKFGKPIESLSERSDEQTSFMNVLVQRLQAQKKNRSEDNVLMIISDARKASLDMRIVDDTALDLSYTKVNKCAEKIFEIWTKTILEKGTQLVFCDFSIPSKASSSNQITNIAEEKNTEKESISELVNAYLENTYTANTNFSVYEDLKIKLVTHGIPEKEIAFIHSAHTASEKNTLFENVNNGTVRVLIGSTKKMGTGMNVQKRLVAAHHLDVPWRPSDLEQRNGRILRQGNIFAKKKDNFEVEIIYYLTENMYDSRMWQILEYKTLAIEQFRKGDLFQRTIDEMQTDSITASEMKALASGNPLALEEVTLRTKRMRLEALCLNYIKSHNAMEKRITELRYSESKIAYEEKMYQENCGLRDSNTKTIMKNNKPQIEFEFVSAENEKLSKKEMKTVAEHFNNALTVCALTLGKHIAIGTYRGFQLSVLLQEITGKRHIQFFFKNKQKKIYSSETLRFDYHEFMEGSMAIDALFLRFNNFLRTFFDKKIEQARELYEAEQAELEVIANEVHKDFLYADELEQVRLDHEALLKQIEESCKK